jgi:hypothetical protein
MNRNLLLIWMLTAFLLSWAIGPVLAENRTDQITEQQAEKSQHLRPYEPNKAERLILRLERWGLITGAAKGFYPFIGSVYSGGGLAGGPGYRFYFGDNNVFDLHGAYSIKGYKMFDASANIVGLGDGKVTSRLHANYTDAGKVAFYGIGNDSSKDDKTSFSFTPVGADLIETIRPKRWLGVGGTLGYMKLETGPGEDSLVPSIEEVFPRSEIPGFDRRLTYITGSIFFEIDTRQGPSYTTNGGLYRVEWLNNNSRERDALDFHRVDVELDQFIPILRANQVIALRASASFTDLTGNNNIPFYLLPTLGGGKELRGFPDFRFRDNHRMLMTAEYRWTPSKFMDAAIFYETGKVASQKSDLDFNDLHDCYGFGVRFHAPTVTALRIEIARSSETTRLIFSASAPF